MSELATTKTSHASMKVNSSHSSATFGSDPCPSSHATKGDAKVCRYCKERVKITNKLKELCFELKLMDDEEARMEEHEAKTKDGKWLAKYIPLITYPLYRRPEIDPFGWREKGHNYPPWSIPRLPSQELVGSKLSKTCDCKKRNGMQDYCQRLMCRGNVQCLKSPEPLCIPSGAWRKMVKESEAEEIINWLGSSDEKNGTCSCLENKALCSCMPSNEKELSIPDKPLTEISEAESALSIATDSSIDNISSIASTYLPVSNLGQSSLNCIPNKPPTLAARKKIKKRGSSCSSFKNSEAGGSGNETALSGKSSGIIMKSIRSKSKPPGNVKYTPAFNF